MNYKNLLYEIQQTNERGPNNQDALILNEKSKVFEVDLSERKIKAPNWISVQSEHRAETVYFLMDRFYGNIDLSQMNCIIQYVTDEGNSYYFPVPFCDTLTVEQKMIVPWTISAAATAAAGSIQYVIRFYLLDDSQLEYDENNNINFDSLKFRYSLSTLPATSRILKSFTMDKIIEESDYHIDTDEKFFELMQIISGMVDNSTVYWTDV